MIQKQSFIVMREWYELPLILKIAILFAIVVGYYTVASAQETTKKKGCLACHHGIAPIRDANSEMMKEIFDMGRDMDDEAGCVPCHGGDPTAKDKKTAHREIIRDPGSLWVADQTCGLCHQDQLYAMKRALMETEAGKIQGTTWDWGALEGRKAMWGNYDTDDPDGSIPRIGTKSYKKYMSFLRNTFPDVYPESLKQLPQVNLDKLKANPNHAAFAYIRQECNRCHIGVKGRSRRGDYRGMGCSACHIPYSNEGIYEGNDPTIPKNKHGYMLTHQIQATREAKIHHNQETYSGIPVETCTTCHNRGKRIGVSYQGLMESPYATPLLSNAKGQPKLHTKTYLYIQDDAHHRQASRKGNPEGGLLCQDCHTTIDVHGDGNIFGTNLAQVEIECTDCHGTPDAYPWELPLGFMEEMGRELKSEPRGTASELLPSQKQGTVYPKQDGYLLTTRGNPLGNVVRSGNEVIVHSATGKDFKPPLLKSLNSRKKWRDSLAGLAMARIKKHLKHHECYTCHSTWAPQCYGCHIKVDFSGGLKSVDWILSGSKHNPDGSTAESPLDKEGIKTPGKSTESRSYTRWMNPPLGINGEGRVSPLMPGCQTVTTVVGPEGNVLVHNKIWRALPNDEGAGPEGQRGIDMSPVTPHTVDKHARACETCHADPKALGYGMAGGRFQKSYTKPHIVDLTNAADGTLIPTSAQTQIEAITDLPMDWSQFVTRDGKQLQTVGSHWPLSGPLSAEQREHVERIGVCMACHQQLHDGKLWIQAVLAVGKCLRPVHSDIQHQNHLADLVKEAAGFMIIIGLLGVMIAVGICYFVWRRRRKD